MARIASLRAGIPVTASAVTINRFCSSGLQAIAFAAERIMCGSASAIVAGGTESMSLVPMGGHTVAPNPTLIDSLSGRLPEHRAGRREPRARIGHLARGAGRVRACAATSARSRPSTPAGSPTRSCRSTARTVDAAERQAPRTIETAFAVDEGPRRDTSRGRAGALRPAFHAQGTVTAGNSSQTSDGAAALSSSRRGTLRKERGLTPLAPLRRLRHRRRRARALRHRPGAGDPQGAEAGRPHAGSDRSRRAERGVRRAGAGVPERAADRSRSAERQRRRHRARPSARLHRREADDDAALRAAAPQRRATAWSRCASAAAWAPPGFSSECSLSGSHRIRMEHGHGNDDNLTRDPCCAAASGCCRPPIRRRLHAGTADRGAPPDRADGHRLRRARGAAGARPPRAEGLGARARRWSSAAASSACSASTSPRSTAACSSTRSTSMVVSERMSQSASFGATFGAQANLIDPAAVALRHRGAEAQVPAAAADRRAVGAYCLSEPGSGSDALGAKTRAARQADGSFVLNGEKMWITNGGFADVFIVFAKVDGEHFTRLHRRARVRRRHERQGRAQDGAARLVDDAGDPAGRQGAGGEPARRSRQGTQDRVQRAEFRAASSSARCASAARAARSARRRATPPSASSSASRSRRSARSSTSSARWSSRTYAVESLIYRTAGLIDARIEATPHDPTDAVGGARNARGVRHRGVDRQSRRQRDARLRARREHPDPRRQRLRARLSGRAPLPRFARQPDFRRHQRNQPPADPAACSPAGR